MNAANHVGASVGTRRRCRAAVPSHVSFPWQRLLVAAGWVAVLPAVLLHVCYACAEPSAASSPAKGAVEVAKLGARFFRSVLDWEGYSDPKEIDSEAKYLHLDFCWKGTASDLERVASKLAHVTHVKIADRDSPIGDLPPRFSDDILAAIALMDNVEHLVISRADITNDGIHALGKMTDLHTLILIDVSITNDVAPALERLTRLRNLAIIDCRLSDGAFRRIDRLTALESLCVRGTNVSDALVEVLGELPCLQRMDVSRTNVTEWGVRELRRSGIEVIAP